MIDLDCRRRVLAAGERDGLVRERVTERTGLDRAAFGAVLECQVGEVTPQDVVASVSLAPHQDEGTVGTACRSPCPSWLSNSVYVTGGTAIGVAMSCAVGEGHFTDGRGSRVG